MRFWALALACLCAILPTTGSTQTKTASSSGDHANTQRDELRYIVYLSRHGVRSPTGKAAQYNLYSSGLWPDWSVPPGYLTPHGFHLMELFGGFDRMQLATQGLLQSTGCAEASKLIIYADSDERTRETGKAIAQGLMPGCNLPVKSQPEGANDPLFHPLGDATAQTDPALAKGAIAGRIGDDPGNLTQAYRLQIAALDQVLSTCGTPPASKPKRISLFDIPATLSEGTGDHVADLKGPLNTASTLSENLLLEYAEGMDGARVGWGCVHRSEIESMMALHEAATDFTQRTPEIARAQASNLLNHIRLSIQQVADQRSIPGAIGNPSDRALFLIGHDTNQENIAGLLNLTWIIDGRRDDTPPGGALIFELWQNGVNGQYSVRTYFTAQTLDQMRTSTPLTLSNPPQRVPIFIPGCSEADMSCALGSFLHLLQQTADQRVFVQK